jgi:small basic protein (TIGR04137 family)
MQALIVNFKNIMSQHRSLKSAGSVGTKRSVLKRGERIKLLKSRGLWKEGRLSVGLPKTKPE